MINKQEFNEMFKKYCVLVSKNPEETIINFYYDTLKYASPSAFKKALYFFACKGFFATVEEIMRECGLNPPKSRKELEKEEIERKKEEKKPKPQEDLTYKEGYANSDGFSLQAFQCTSFAENEKDAKADFEKQAQEKLVANGWTVVEYINIGECKLQQDKILKTAFTCQITAHRKKPL